jgi:uncharacterized protein YidB (DUF937 family)
MEETLMDDLSKRSTSLDSGSSSGSEPADPAAVAGLTGAIQQTGGLDGLVGKLRAGGLEREVDSWVSTGPNEPVDPQQLGQALGPDTVQQLSAGSGIDVRSLLPLLAMFLPQIIDMLTKNGSTPAGGLDGAAGQGGLPDLGGLLGGLLGGALGGGQGSTGASGTTDRSDLSDLLRELGGDKPR